MVVPDSIVSFGPNNDLASLHVVTHVVEGQASIYRLWDACYHGWEPTAKLTEVPENDVVCRLGTLLQRLNQAIPMIEGIIQRREKTK